METRLLFHCTFLYNKTMSYSDFYQYITKPFLSHPSWIPVLKFMNRALTYVFYVIYPLFLIHMYLTDITSAIPYTFVPAAGFVLCTLIRAGINAQRPYEAESITPLIFKDTVHRSFPSRHCFSASIISCTIGCVFPSVGIVLFVFAVIEGIIRVIAGIHYPRDVLAGLVSGALCMVVYCIF